MKERERRHENVYKAVRGSARGGQSIQISRAEVQEGAQGSIGHSRMMRYSLDIMRTQSGTVGFGGCEKVNERNE